MSSRRARSRPCGCCNLATLPLPLPRLALSELTPPGRSASACLPRAQLLVKAHILLVGVAVAVASRSLCQLWDNVVGHYRALRTSRRLTTRCVRPMHTPRINRSTSAQHPA